MKYYHRLQNILRTAILAALIFVLFTEPGLVAAAPQPRDLHAEAVTQLVTSGEAYLNSASKTITESMALMGYLDTIHNTPLNQISESYVTQAIDHALNAAEQSSMAIGSVNTMSEGFEKLGGPLPEADNITGILEAGIPAEMRAELGTLGASAANLDQISVSTMQLYTERQAGISAEQQASLRGFGFSQEQIDQISKAVSERGVAKPGMTTRLDQFRATQDELADTRTGMLIVAVQLMGYQIAIRQANGIAPVAIIDENLSELSQDELRLLVHIAHLTSEWGNDPSTDIGEGEWWFIEHYAGRAAERLQDLTIQSQNRGLVVELFALHQLKMLAISARTGNAAYAKAELKGLAGLLSYHLNATAFFSEHQTAGILERTWAGITSTPFLREKLEWPIPGHSAKNARLVMQNQLSASKVEDLASILGSFEESNEANNIGGLLFVAGLSSSQLDASVVNETMNLGNAFVNGNAWLWLNAIMTGDTDNPALLVANVIIGFIPVLNIISDVWTLLSNPLTWWVALGIFALICDIGSTLSFLAVQAELVGLTWLGKGAKAVIAGLSRTKAAVVAKFTGKELPKVIQVIVDLVKVVIGKLGDSILGRSLDEVIRVLGDILSGPIKAWENFCAFVLRAEWDLIVRLGINDGSLFLGRVIKSGATLSDEALIALKYVGDDLVEAGVELSDDAVKGLGRSAKVLNVNDLRPFVGKYDPDMLENVMKSFSKFDEATLTAAAKVRQLTSLDDFGALALKYASNPDDLVYTKGIFEGLSKALSGKYPNGVLALAKSATDADKPYLGRYLAQLESIELAKLSVEKVFKMSKLAQGADGFPSLDIAIAGRLADTTAEANIRTAAATEAATKINAYLQNGLPADLPQSVLDYASESYENFEEVATFLGKFETAPKYDILWPQVKVSTGDPAEVDLFIPLEQWNRLSAHQKYQIQQRISEVTGKLKIDLYQEIVNPQWMHDVANHFGLPLTNPATTFPNGALRFCADGRVLHPFIQGPQP